MNTANSIRFVRFNTDQMVGTKPTATEAAAIYAGTVISTVTPTGASSLYTATYVWNSTNFPTTGTYYVYAILNPNPGGDCYALQEFIVNITPTLSITTQPSDISECIGGTQSFSVVATGGAAPLSYQWQSSSTVSGVYTNIIGANSATYPLPSTGTSALFYRVIVTSASGSVCNTSTSNAVAGTVVNDPSVSVTTLPATVCTNASITLSATPTISAGSCTVQWQSSPDGTTWTNIIGGTGASYNIGTLASTTRYRAQLVSCTGSGCCN
jgi:hypothetical protein